MLKSKAGSNEREPDVYIWTNICMHMYHFPRISHRFVRESWQPTVEGNRYGVLEPFFSFLFKYCIAILQHKAFWDSHDQILFYFFFLNVFVQSSIPTLIWWNYNLKKNLKICKITSYFANTRNDDPPLSGVEPRIFNGCRICQDIIFIHQDITNARNSSALNVRFMLPWLRCI